MRPAKPIFLLCPNEEQRELWTYRLRVSAPEGKSYKVMCFTDEQELRSAIALWPPEGQDGAVMRVEGSQIGVAPLLYGIEGQIKPLQDAVVGGVLYALVVACAGKRGPRKAVA